MGRSVTRSKIRKMKLRNKTKKKKTIKRRASKVSSKIQRTTTIEQLNDHCLTKIFDSLSIEDLVNISVSSKRFQVSTCIVFERKFGKNLTTISNEVLPQTSQLPSVSLLKTFGHLIEKLKVYYKEDFIRFNNALEQAIIKYCTMYVTEIRFIKADKFALVKIKKPLTKVAKVVFDGCVVGRLNFEFNKWFPNARSLALLEPIILSRTDVVCLEQEFPKLEHLAIVDSKHHGDGDRYGFEEKYDSVVKAVFSNVNLKAAIDLNPQLRSLKLKHNGSNIVPLADCNSCIDITPNLLAYINEKLPLLDELDLVVVTGVNINTLLYAPQHIEVPQHIHFKCLRKIRFVVNSSDTMKHYSISTSKPAKLIIDACYLNESLSVFLQQNKMWSKIVFYGDWSHKSYERIKIHLQKLPVLSSIKISVNGSMDGKQNQVLSLLNESKYLKKLKIVFSIVQWANMSEGFDYDDERREELNFLDTEYWKEYLRDIEADWDSNGIKNALPEMLEKHGNYTLEMYRKAFEDQHYNLWQSIYHKQGHFFCATFENKQLSKN